MAIPSELRSHFASRFADCFPLGFRLRRRRLPKQLAQQLALVGCWLARLLRASLFRPFSLLLRFGESTRDKADSAIHFRLLSHLIWQQLSSCRAQALKRLGSQTADLAAAARWTHSTARLYVVSSHTSPAGLWARAATRVEAGAAVMRPTDAARFARRDLDPVAANTKRGVG